MYNKSCRNVSILFTAVLFILANEAKGITAEELAAKCQSAENAIKDISMEYEWYQIPPLTHEEEEQEEPFKSIGVLIHKDGITKCKLTAAPFVDPNGRRQWRDIFEEAATLTTKDGKSWEYFGKSSYNSKVFKKYSNDGWPTPVKEGGISSNSEELPLLLTPIGFSVFRFELSGASNGKKLSYCLRYKEKEIVRVADSANKVNDFNTICVEFLQEYTKLPCVRVYFSVDHNYTPVKYEYLNSGKGGTRLNFAVDIHSLEQIGDNLWFPSSGTISAPDKKHVDAFQIMGTIQANQDLEQKDFDIEFPAGTKVQDKIANRKYVVGEDKK